MPPFYTTSSPIATNILKNFPLFSLALEGRGQGEGEFFFYIPVLKNGDWLLF